MTNSVRPARSEDAEAACRVVRDSIEQCCAEDHEGDPLRLDAWLRNKTPDNFLAWIQRDDLHCVVAEGASGVMGFGMASTAGEVLLCYAAPSARFQGVGKAVLRDTERWAVATGLTGLGEHEDGTAVLQTQWFFSLRAGYQLRGYDWLPDAQGVVGRRWYCLKTEHNGHLRFAGSTHRRIRRSGQTHACDLNPACSSKCRSAPAG